MSENDFSRKVKKLRAMHGLTLEQVASRVGVGKSTVRKWENGMIENIRRDKIASLASALHTTPAYLMGWEEENSGDSFPAASSHTSFIDHDPLIDEIVTLLSEATPEQLASVIRYIKFTLQDG